MSNIFLAIQLHPIVLVLLFIVANLSDVILRNCRIWHKDLMVNSTIINRDAARKILMFLAKNQIMATFTIDRD